MSGPQDLQRIGQMFGGPAGAQARPGGPKPTMPIGQTAKRLGDSRIPMSKEIPRRNPGAVQTQAAVKLGVRPNQVERVPRAPQTQAPPAQAPQVRPQAPPAAPQPKVNPVVTALEKRMPLPPSDPRRGMNTPSQDTSLGSDIQRMLDPVREEYGPRYAPAEYGPEYTPPSGMQGRRSAANAASQGGSVSLPPGSTSTDPMQLIQTMADAAREKAQQTPAAQTPTAQAPAPRPASRAPVPQMTPTAPVPQVQPAPQPPAATQPKLTVTNPVPPGTAPKPPEAFRPTQGTNPEYRVIPNATPKTKTGNEKQVVNRGDKGNSAFLYRDFGPSVQDWDNVALGQAMKALRAKAVDPKRKVPLTLNEVRILTKNADVGTSNKGVPLESMLPEALKRRMDELNSMVGKPVPGRNEDRVMPGAVPPSATPGPIVPKTTPGRPVDKAVILQNDAIQNPAGPPKGFIPFKKAEDGKVYNTEGVEISLDENG